MLLYLLSITPEEDQEKVEFLFKKYNQRMVRYAAYLLRYADRRDHSYSADDIAQEAWVRIHTYIHNIDLSRSDKSVESYLMTIVLNVSRDMLKNAENYTEYDDNLVYNESEFLAQINVRNRYDEVMKAVGKLDAIYKSTLMLYHKDKYKAREIAKMFGVPVKTVESRLKRGSEKLLKILNGGKKNG